jgi:adenine-specific DNA-methyltransferase
MAGKAQRSNSKRKRSESKITIVGSPDVNSVDGVNQYVHSHDKRPYNPPVGLVTAETDKEEPKKKYMYDPHLDPTLTWAGKAERTSLEVDTVSLHVHERIDPLTIMEKVIRKETGLVQMSLFPYFDSPENNPPLREAIHFYKHSQNWSNRLIAGDSLLVMNSLLQKESMAGKVQMIYIDPPYGIHYSSNFQPFVNKRDVRDKDEDLTQEPEMVKAFRDTWELGIHSYLTYLRDRLLLSRELLADTGSVFVQISDENVHHVREIMDEIFGAENFISVISVKRSSMMFTKKFLNNATYFLLWYSKDSNSMKYRHLYKVRDFQFMAESAGSHLRIESPDGKTSRALTSEERNNIDVTMEKLRSWRLYRLLPLNAQGTEKRQAVEFQGKKYYPAEGQQWKTSLEGLEILRSQNRLEPEKNALCFKTYFDDYPIIATNSLWEEIGAAADKIYVVQTPTEVVKRCMLMTTDPGDLVFDPTCGSGTTAFVAEEWGRRWVTCETSRVAVAITKQRMITSTFDYFELAHPDQGVSSGFSYETVPHITLTSIVNNESAPKESLYDHPKIDRSKKRITGPFTIEAVPSQRVFSFEEDESLQQEADTSIARSGESVLATNWVDELRTAGIKGKSGQKIEFSRLEHLAATRYLHAEGETKDSESKRVVVSFGSPYTPYGKEQVELAIEEAQRLVPKPKIVVFAAFQFDPEAARNIDETNWPGVTLIKVQMNTDLLTHDLRKKHPTNESFWLVGQPDVELENKGKEYVVSVKGFDYYNTTTGEIESGDIKKVAMWMLDTNYDGRSLYPRQIFFPMAGEKDGWGKLARNLRAELDEDVLNELFEGNKSLPFELGDKKRVAVKIIDDRGIESMRIIEARE